MWACLEQKQCGKDLEGSLRIFEGLATRQVVWAEADVMLLFGGYSYVDAGFGPTLCLGNLPWHPRPKARGFIEGSCLDLFRWRVGCFAARESCMDALTSVNKDEKKTRIHTVFEYCKTYNL